MWACVITMAFTVSPCFSTTSKTRAISSPGSTTSASRLCSSPKIEQLHCNIPTGRISWIMNRLYTHGMGDVLGVIMRWLHYSSLTTLIGGILYGRLVMLPASPVAAPDEREALADRAAVAFRPYVLAAICGLVVSGVYNILTHPGHRPIYQLLSGLQLLLALHVFTVALLIARPGHPRR